ncbi:hypothetical protein E0Z10_g1213 [Xylaria hypoxylon]|uniref:Azaphilone pigments biosynthesis cluster protein L N-terminal domain-containing protein n=1 Tax=Xylaria hypoxylon TaxID=37992 RepID=A0A4Z0ZFG1_9PEZI|nr:hypothetical protein E0Z10_g1213 [Xylaria hypoxylon]
MDPLSLTASIIAVVTAAGQISKGLRSLYELRHAPQEVVELANEVNELQALLCLVQRATGNVSTSDLAPEDQLILKRLLDSAKEPLEELDGLIAVCIRKADTSNVGSGTCSNISFTAWIRSRRSVALAALSNIRGQAENRLIVNIHDLVVNQAKEPETPARTKEEHPSGLGHHLGYVSTEKLDGTISAQNTGLVLKNSLSSPAEAIETEPVLVAENEVTLHGGSIPNRPSLRRIGMYTTTKLLVPTHLSFSPVDVKQGLNAYHGIRKLYHEAWLHIQRHEAAELRKLLRQRVVYVDDLSDDDGTPLLTYALKFRSYDIVELLLQYGANLDLVDPRGISARAHAQSTLLIDRPIQRPPWSAHIGFNIDEVGVHNDLRFTPLHYIVIGLEKADLRQQLRLNGVHMDSADAFGRSPLHWAAITGNISAIEALIEHGASTTCVDKQQMTPLHAVYLAPSSSQAQCGRLLVASGADVDALDVWNRTPIRIAAGFNNTSLEFLDMLVQKGADVNHRDSYGQSALLKSIQGRKEVTQLLIHHGADTDARDKYGNTPVLEAIYRDKPEKLQALLEHGSRIDEPFELKPGRSARSGPIHLLDYVAWYGGTAVMKVIEEMPDCRYHLSYPRDSVEAFRDFRLANGRKAEEKECEAFRRILSR